MGEGRLWPASRARISQDRTLVTRDARFPTAGHAVNAEWRLKLDTDWLLKCAAQAIRNSVGPSVEIDADYYWTVLTPGLYDVMSDPELAIGQLSEDVDVLQSADEEAYLGAMSLLKIAALLTAVANHELGETAPRPREEGN